MSSSPESKKRKVDEQLGLEKKGSPELSSTKVRKHRLSLKKRTQEKLNSQEMDTSSNDHSYCSSRRSEVPVSIQTQHMLSSTNDAKAMFSNALTPENKPLPSVYTPKVSPSKFCEMASPSTFKPMVKSNLNEILKIHTNLANKLGIKPEIAKKYINILTSKPRVHVFKTVAITQNAESINIDRHEIRSPTFGLKKRNKSQKIDLTKSEQKSPMNENPEGKERVNHYFKSLTKSPRKDDNAGNVKKSKIKESGHQEIIKKKNIKLEVFSNSSDEFEASKKQNINFKSNQQPDISTDDICTINDTKQNNTNEDKARSLRKRNKLTKRVAKHHSSDSDVIFISDLPPLDVKKTDNDKENRKKKDKNKLKSNQENGSTLKDLKEQKRVKNKKSTKISKSSDTDLSEGSSKDSISVNCHLFGKNIHKEKTEKTKSVDHKRLLCSFGSSSPVHIKNESKRNSNANNSNFKKMRTIGPKSDHNYSVMDETYSSLELLSSPEKSEVNNSLQNRTKTRHSPIKFDLKSPTPSRNKLSVPSQCSSVKIISDNKISPENAIKVVSPSRGQKLLKLSSSTSKGSSRAETENRDNTPLPHAPIKDNSIRHNNATAIANGVSGNKVQSTSIGRTKTLSAVRTKINARSMPTNCTSISSKPQQETLENNKISSTALVHGKKSKKKSPIVDDSKHMDSNSENHQQVSITPVTSAQGIKSRLGPKIDQSSFENEQSSMQSNSEEFDKDWDELCKDLDILNKCEFLTLHAENQSEKLVVNNEGTFSTADTSEKDDRIDKTSNDENPKTSTPHKKLQLCLKSIPVIPLMGLKSNDSDDCPQSSSPDSNKKFSTPTKKRLKLKTMSPSTMGLSDRDPRLTRSNSPYKMLNSMNNSSLSSSPTKNSDLLELSNSRPSSPILSPSPKKDPRLLRGSSRPRSMSPGTNLPKNGDPIRNSESSIVDPRMRKRKEREEAERAAKISRNETIKDASNESIHSPDTSQEPTTPSATGKRKLSVFDRLGSARAKTRCISPSKNTSVNEFASIIESCKANRSEDSSSKEDGNSDDDNLSIFAGDAFFSEEEDDNDSSPRHRKFTSERSTCLKDGEKILETRPSVRDRLGNSSTHRQVKNNINSTQSVRPSTVNSMAIPPLMGVNVGKILPPLSRPSVHGRISLVGNRSVNSNTATAPSTSIKSRLTLNGNVRSPIVPPDEGNTFVPNPMAAAAASRIASTGFNDAFYEMNEEQMNRDMNEFYRSELDNPSVTFGNGSSTPFDHVSMLDTPSTPRQIGQSFDQKPFFYGFCFQTLRVGKCSHDTNCRFSHGLQSLVYEIKRKSPLAVGNILEQCIRSDFVHFIESIWATVLPILNNDAFTIFEKLYKASIRSRQLISSLFNFCMDRHLFTVEAFVKKISTIIDKGDQQSVVTICGIVKNKMNDGFCWESIKDLAQKCILPNDIIELSLLQCLKRKKSEAHIKEIYNLLVFKMSNYDRSSLNQNLLNEFYSLVKRFGVQVDSDSTNLGHVTTAINEPKNQVVCHSQINKTGTKFFENGMSSAEIDKSVEFVVSNQIASPTHVPTSNERQPNNSPLEVQAKSPNKGENTNFVEYAVKKIDMEQQDPTSVFRNRFWKLYLAVRNIEEGLSHEDYDYVWKTLDEMSREPVNDELVRRAYYQILCQNVLKSEQHITEVIRRAVKSTSSTKSVEILFEVCISALIDLAVAELWLMALQLLDWVKIIEPDEPKTAYVLIRAEIYLANYDPVEALYLLQKTRLIRTNRDEWLTTDHTQQDLYHRNKIVFILLKALSFNDPEKAFYLFNALLNDQYIYYFPIDVSSYVDTFIFLLMWHRKIDLVADVGRLVMDNEMTFRKETYQELLNAILPYEETLAFQILEYATNLGYYNDLKIRDGFATIIIDSNIFEEELYLIIKRMVSKIRMAVGQALHKLKPQQLKINIVFEDIPDENRLLLNETAVIERDRYKRVRNLLVKLLGTHFTPPIRVQKRKSNKYVKIISKTLVNYLKCWS
ncbi:uncharacterized protein LOC106648969 [Trichogramma pretiosum]|uniref:uncharacterized protein LOC106648969 n=1 Tax=Trichogramma pretiosum TaxID=7493 RepID=UPI0006C9B84F|nr:uncharacterized protein LOC106648969 [Trichogramma pretiosum]